MEARKMQKRGLARVSHLFLSDPSPRRQKVSIQVAAKTLGVSKGKIITYLNEGLLNRIKVDGRIYLSMDEVKALGETKKRPPVKSPVSFTAKSNENGSLTKERDRSRRPLASFGLLESERQHLLKCKAALEDRDNKLETLTSEVEELKRSLEIQIREWKGTVTRLEAMEKEQRERLLGFKKITEAREQERKEIQTRLQAFTAELKRLHHPWWKELFAHLRLGPEPCRKKKVLLVATLALLAGLIFSGWWLSRTPQQTPSVVAKAQPPGSGTVQAGSQAVLDADSASSSYPD